MSYSMLFCEEFVKERILCCKKLNSYHIQNDTQSMEATKPLQHPNHRIYQALKLTLLILIILGVIVLMTFFFGTDLGKAQILQMLYWLTDLPTITSSLVMILLYALALLFFFPGTPFNLAAGFLYGEILGSIVALAGCILGALIAFILGRTIARDWALSKMSRNPKFKAIDWALQKKGLYIVLLTRLSPLLPFPLLNYAFGATKIKFWQYLLGTSLGVAPTTIAYTYLGTLIRNVAELWEALEGDEADDEDHHQFIIWGIGGGFTILSIILITYITQRTISKATKEYEKLESDRQNIEMEPTPPDLDPIDSLEEWIEP